jgi:hypothetical protein
VINDAKFIVNSSPLASLVALSNVAGLTSLALSKGVVFMRRRLLRDRSQEDDSQERNSTQGEQRPSGQAVEDVANAAVEALPSDSDKKAIVTAAIHSLPPGAVDAKRDLVTTAPLKNLSAGEAG